MKPYAPRPHLIARTRSASLELLENRIAPAAFVVDTALDVVAADGFISLREAIQAANTNLAVNEAPAGDADGDSITFNLPDGSIIDLTLGTLNIDDDLIIDGFLPSTKMEIDGLDAARIFSVNTAAGAGTSTDVILFNLRLENGSVTGNGGAILHSANLLSLFGVDVHSSDALGATGSGGAILNAGVLVVTGGLFTNNTAVRAGGAIEGTAGSTTTLNGVDGSNNSTGSTPGNGGFLHLTGAGTVTVNGGNFQGNIASAEGGAFWNSATGIMTIEGAFIEGNTAQGDVDPSGNPALLQGGGGVFNDGGTLTILSTTIQNNLATGATRGSGGGLMSIAGTVIVRNSSFIGNEAIRAGGGVEIIAGNLTLDSVDLENNDVSATDGVLTTANPGNGGALHVTGAAGVLLIDCDVVNNRASAEGGGLWNSATGNMSVTGGFFEDNAALGDGTEQGGGALFNDGGTVSVKDSFFGSNFSTATAVGNGGGAIFNDGTMTLVRVNIENNTANSGTANGGGILNSNGGTLTYSSGLVYGNSTARAGGGLENVGGTVVLNSVSFEQNHAGINGGAVHSSGGSVTVNRGFYTSNDADNEGGALWNGGTGIMTVTNATIASNDAAVGGGIFQKGAAGSLTVSRSLLRSNTAVGGGGIASEGGLVSIVLSTLFSNQANSGTGGGVLILDGTANIDNSTLYSNSSFINGDNLFQANGVVSIGSSILAGGSNDIGRVGGTLNAGHSLVQSAAPIVFNGTTTSVLLGSDPELLPLGDNGGPTETLALSPTSPAINAGANNLALPTDQRGAPFARVQGAAADIGAFEAPPAPVVTIAANGKKATFTDVDGDLVTITTNLGTFAQSNFFLVAEGIGARLVEFDIDGETEFTGANISIKAKRSALGGDGLVNVEEFDADFVDLGKVIIDGDLQYFYAGDDNLATTGVVGLNVLSLGEFAQEAEIEVYGELKNLTVRADVVGADIFVDGNLGLFKSFGTVVDTDIEVTGSMTTFTVMANLLYSDLHVEGSIGSFAATVNPAKFRNIGGVVVKGTVIDTHIGANGDVATFRVFGEFSDSSLTVRGDLAPVDQLAAQTVGILSVAGRVMESDFFIGYDLDFNAVNPEVQVATVTFGGSYVASNLAVGAEEGADGLFGTDDDLAINGGGAIVSRIAMLTVKGHAYGSSPFFGTGDHYGIVAQEIVKARLGLAYLPLTAGAGNNLTPIIVGSTFDLAAREVSTV